MIETKDIQQTVTIKANPHEVYEALMDSKKHAQFTGAPAEISREIEGAFTAHGGYISGKNLELVQDEKIVQTWRGAEWPQDHYSTITFLLKPTKDGTELLFSQSGIPVEHVGHISEGWGNKYWIPLKKELEK